MAEQPDALFAHEDPTTLLRARTSFAALLASLRFSTPSPNAVWTIPAWDSSAIFTSLPADLAAALSGRPVEMALPEAMGQLWPRARDIWQARGESWDFWINWYEDLLAGREPNWALLEKVALIPDEIWQQGAGAVAEAIARIEEQMRLHREVVQLKAQLVSARAEIAALSRRGHNNPPELLDPVADVERQAGAIAVALDEAEAELAKDAPRPAVLRRVGRVLLTTASSAISYCASLGDVAARKAVEAFGAAGGTALVAALVGQWEAVESLAKALLAFAKSFDGG